MLISEPFATTADLEARWRTLSTAEKATAGVLLADASNLIVEECPSANEVEDGDAVAFNRRSAALKRIVCAMVKRAMLAPADQPPMTQISMSAGPFSSGGTIANPTGDLYLTKSERRSLPCGRQQAFTVQMVSVDWDEDDLS